MPMLQALAAASALLTTPWQGLNYHKAAMLAMLISTQATLAGGGMRQYGGHLLARCTRPGYISHTRGKTETAAVCEMNVSRLTVVD